MILLLQTYKSSIFQVLEPEIRGCLVLKKENQWVKHIQKHIQKYIQKHNNKVYNVEKYIHYAKLSIIYRRSSAKLMS